MKEKLKQERLRAMTTAHAAALAFGGMKNEDFNKYLESLYTEKVKNTDKALEEAKELGLPVEEI